MLGGMLVQAAEQGDAGKADKRRKKNKAAAEEAQFYVEDDDEVDYKAPEGRDSRLAGTGVPPDQLSFRRNSIKVPSFYLSSYIGMQFPYRVA